MTTSEAAEGIGAEDRENSYGNVEVVTWKPTAGVFLPVETPQRVCSIGWVVAEDDQTVTLVTQLPNYSTPVLIPKSAIIARCAKEQPCLS